MFSVKILICTSIFLCFSQKGCVIAIFTQMVMFLRLLMKGLFSWAFSRQRRLLRVFTKGIKMTFFWLPYYFTKNWKDLSKKATSKSFLSKKSKWKMFQVKKTKSNKFKSKTQSFHPVLGIFLSNWKYPVQGKILKKLKF